MDIHLMDDWIEPESMKLAFKDSMEKPRWNASETIDYAKLKVGETVTLEKQSDKW